MDWHKSYDILAIFSFLKNLERNLAYEFFSIPYVFAHLRVIFWSIAERFFYQ